MAKGNLGNIPKNGIAGYVQNWRADFFAAISVSLVALPLCLGIAIASEAPPMSGIIAAIVGGLFTTFIRSSQVTINGPGASLIVVILTANQILEWPQVLAAIVISGAFTAILGWLRLGRLGEAFPSAVVQGMLAAIGLIIIAKQAHMGIGAHSSSDNVLDTFIELKDNLSSLNPYVTFITVMCIGIMAIYPRIKNKLVHFVPPPIWVLLFAVPMVLVFKNADALGLSAIGINQGFGSEYLIHIPGKLTDSIVFPDFSQINTLKFWGVVFGITILGSIVTLISNKAVDRLDPFDRRTNLNKDLRAVGLSTIISGCLGGLPIIALPVRSSVNINHGARTKMSNFWHAALLLLFVVILSDLIQNIPLGALAAILIYTGYKLASPREFAEAYYKGEEQLIIVINTIVASMVMGLMWGIAIGMLSDLVIQLMKSHVGTPLFFRNVFQPIIKRESEKAEDHYITLRGIFNFLNLLRLKRVIQRIPQKEHIVVSFADTMLVDFTVLEYVHDYAEKYNREGGVFEVVGLDQHLTASAHPNALHLMKDRGRSAHEFLTKRQKDMEALCTKHGWTFEPGINWHLHALNNFQFFRSRLIEHGTNVIRGQFERSGLEWNIQDIDFDEGALASRITYHSTVIVCNLPFGIPEFVLEKEELFDKIMNFGTYEDIDITSFKEFSDRYLLKGPNEEAIRDFFRPSLTDLLTHSDIYHIESSGSSLMVFKNIRLASRAEMLKLYRFTDTLVDTIMRSHSTGSESVGIK